MWLWRETDSKLIFFFFFSPFADNMDDLNHDSDDDLNVDNSDRFTRFVL